MRIDYDEVARLQARAHALRAREMYRLVWAPLARLLARIFEQKPRRASRMIRLHSFG